MFADRRPLAIRERGVADGDPLAIIHCGEGTAGDRADAASDAGSLERLVAELRLHGSVAKMLLSALFGHNHVDVICRVSACD